MGLPEKTEAQRPHTIFLRQDCNFCSLFQKHLIGTDLERFFNVVDVQRSPVDPRQIQSVPTIVVDHNTVYVGRDAFAWLLNELKRSIMPMACVYAGAAPAPLDGSDNVCLAPMAPSNFGDPEKVPQGDTSSESLEARLTRIKAERG